MVLLQSRKNARGINDAPVLAPQRHVALVREAMCCVLVPVTDSGAALLPAADRCE